MHTPPVMEPLESGDPLLDQRALRRCLGQFPTGVTVMTTRHGERPVGVTANSFASVSMSPPLVLWSIGLDSRSYAAFASAPQFNINILSTDQIDLSQRFAGRDEDKFAGVPWHPGKLGEPVLPAVLACLECTVEARHRGGDHMILIGRVRHYARNAGHPLLYAQGRYAMAEDHPQLVTSAAQGAAPSGPSAAGQQTVRLTTALSLVGIQLSSAFDELRTREGLDLPQGRVLSTLRGSEPLSSDEIAEQAYVARQATDDALASLQERHYVVRRDGGYMLTDDGRALLKTMTERFGSLEGSLLEGLAQPKLAAARELLQALLSRLRPAQ
ncbi:hypothetical protein FOZ76_16350 [Verticiella sediminum]|uniref:HTH marR-type domain-containing protein n=1 Tax=Verticiella sediminum TaxID=1247510 RepID=A0A556AJ91_9BURK|nr:flavin reductase [Verticiella sediminum]TSH92957.1 hypothetical protein FOZ76_16350 [Verticiella sediminum]